MRRFAQENGLSLFFLTIFLATLAGQSFAGQHNYNADQAAHGAQPSPGGQYVPSPSFGGAVMENWQSEFLQFSLFIAATIWLVQKGSNESKALDDDGIESDEAAADRAAHTAERPRGGPGGRLAHAHLRELAPARDDADLLRDLVRPVAQQLARVQRRAGDAPRRRCRLGQLLVNADFWEQTLQNWQSEFLAVGTMVVFTIYLRQRGSPESKPVGAPHDETATSG